MVATKSSSSEEDIEEQSEEETLNVVSKLFEDDVPFAINKICQWNPSTSKNLYPRPSPLALQMRK